MRVIKKTAVLPYSASEMYSLVNDVESYPDYLPWCRETTVHVRSEVEVRATIHLARGGIQQSFSTLNRMRPNEWIEVSLLEGPFRHLKGTWQFEALEEHSCRVSFNFEFLLSNRILDMAVGPVLEKIANNFLDAFEQRAQKVFIHS